MDLNLLVILAAVSYWILLAIIVYLTRAVRQLRRMIFEDRMRFYPNEGQGGGGVVPQQRIG